jgi:hypothetical protein
MEGDTCDQLRTQPRQAREIDAKRFRQARANSATAIMRSLQSPFAGDLSVTRRIAETVAPARSPFLAINPLILSKCLLAAGHVVK